MKSKVATHRNLTVYNKAKTLTVDIIKHFSNSEIQKTNNFVVLQLLRATSSVGANIAEGYGRYYEKSYRHFLSIARGSAFEVEYWLDIVADIYPLQAKQIEKYK